LSGDDNTLSPLPVCTSINYHCSSYGTNYSGFVVQPASWMWPWDRIIIKPPFSRPLPLSPSLAATFIDPLSPHLAPVFWPLRYSLFVAISNSSWFGPKCTHAMVSKGVRVMPIALITPQSHFPILYTEKNTLFKKTLRICYPLKLFMRFNSFNLV